MHRESDSVGSLREGFIIIQSSSSLSKIDWSISRLVDNVTIVHFYEIVHRKNYLSWKGHVDFNEGLHSMFNSRTFTTALEAEGHMRQFAHQCIDNRLNATQPYGF